MEACYRSRRALLRNRVAQFSGVLHTHSWFTKEFRSPGALLLAIIVSAV
jgi:hypothetical protein